MSEKKGRKKATENQQFTPVAEKDAIYKAIAKAEAKGKTRAHDIQAALERDKLAATGGWWDENYEFFYQFKKKAGE